MADCITFCSDIPPAEFSSSLEQNCVVLTRREKPREIEALEGPRTPVCSLRLSGLSEEAARSLLQQEDAHGTLKHPGPIDCPIKQPAAASPVVLLLSHLEEPGWRGFALPRMQQRFVRRGEPSS